MSDSELFKRSRELWPRRWRLAVDTLYSPNPAPITLPFGKKMNTLYNFARDTIGDGPVTYLEFGVFRGDSIRRMAQLFTHPESRFFGFDSFEGLPEDWGAGHPKGDFSTGGLAPDTKDPRITFVKGYFQNSLPAFLSTPRPPHATLVHYDADLYSATLFVMSTLWHHLSEYYFIFDEFIPDEVIAMYDFTRAFPTEFSFKASVKSKDSPENDPSPHQVFGHIKRTVFTP